MIASAIQRMNGKPASLVLLGCTDSGVGLRHQSLDEPYVAIVQLK